MKEQEFEKPLPLRMARVQSEMTSAQSYFYCSEKYSNELFSPDQLQKLANEVSSYNSKISSTNQGTCSEFL
jgi:hypothetical protein